MQNIKYVDNALSLLYKINKSMNVSENIYSNTFHFTNEKHK